MVYVEVVQLGAWGSVNVDDVVRAFGIGYAGFVRVVTFAERIQVWVEDDFGVR